MSQHGSFSPSPARTPVRLALIGIAATLALLLSVGTQPAAATTPALPVAAGDVWNLDNGAITDGDEAQITLRGARELAAVTVEWMAGPTAIDEIAVSPNADGSGRVVVASSIPAGTGPTTVTLGTSTTAAIVWITLASGPAKNAIRSVTTTYSSALTSFDEDFESASTGTIPAEWKGSPASTTSVQPAPGGGQALTFAHDGVNHLRADTDEHTVGTTTFHARVYLTQANTTFGVHLGTRGGSNSIASFAASVYAMANGKWTTYSGTASVIGGTYTTNTWHTLDVTIDHAADQFDLAIDGTTIASDANLRNDVGVGAIYLNTFGSGSGSMIVDDLTLAWNGPESVDIGPDYPYIGTLSPRPASDITDSPWSVGGETLDRDIAYYDGYKEYLGDLGATRIRLQAGWAKTESTPGIYDYTWLDAIVDDAIAQGVTPWLELSYGNPAYAGGGSSTIGGGLPSSASALVAWDSWVAATVDRYEDRIEEWEIWNEPNGAGIPAATFADFHARTAAIVRAEQPSARIIGVAASGTATTYIGDFLAQLQATGNLGLVDEISFHPYANNPDSTYAALAGLRSKIATYSSTITLRQGENGAPVVGGECGAMNDHDWTTYSAAKWNARRLLGDLAADIPVTSIFQMVDLVYNAGCTVPVGLLETDASKVATGPRDSYRAVQTITALIDGRWTRAPGDLTVVDVDRPTNSAAYTRDDGQFLATSWYSDEIPTESVSSTLATWVVPSGALTAPVFIDVLTGKVYAIPSSAISTGAAGTTEVLAPETDWPLALVDRSLLAREGTVVWTEDFSADTIGQAPAGFTGSATGTIVTTDPAGGSNPVLAFLHSGTNWLRHDDSRWHSDLVTLTYRVRAAQTDNTFGAHLADYQGSNAIASFATGLYTLGTGQWRTFTGSTAVDAGLYGADVWHDVEITLDQDRQAFWLTVDGDPLVVGAPARNPYAVGDLGSVILNAFGTGVGTAYYDDFVVTTQDGGPTFSVAP